MLLIYAAIIGIISGLFCLWDSTVSAKKRKTAALQFVSSAYAANEKIDAAMIHAKLKPSGTIQTVQIIFLLALLIFLVESLGIELTLVVVLFASLLIWLATIFFHAWASKKFKLKLDKKRNAIVPENFAAFSVEDKTAWYGKKLALESSCYLRDSLRTTFIIIFAIVLIRSFLFEPFRVPSGSLEPTIKPGDFILVNKFDYGLRLPVLHTKILNVGEPKVGDIVVFHWPANPHIDYIKRVIGVPGDTISYINKKLYVNGKLAPQQFVRYTTDTNGHGHHWLVVQKREDLLGVKHGIYLRPNVPAQNFKDLVVPKGYYFMMGDNRDDSLDSRYWGFVPQKDIVGKAVLIWFSWRGVQHFSWDNLLHAVRWQRIFTLI